MMNNTSSAAGNDDCDDSISIISVISENSSDYYPTTKESSFVSSPQNTTTTTESSPSSTDDLVQSSPSPPSSPSSSSHLWGLELESYDQYPNATIQFRKPFFEQGGDERNDDDDEDELELLHDFLIHTEDYVRYPRSKLTILLRVAPELQRQGPTDLYHCYYSYQEQLEHLQKIVNEAASTSTSTGGLQVFIATAQENDDDLLRCAPIPGSYLMNFDSIQELPEKHTDFLIDLLDVQQVIL